MASLSDVAARMQQKLAMLLQNKPSFFFFLFFSKWGIKPQPLHQAMHIAVFIARFRVFKLLQSRIS
jgi:hypothetical protein